MPSACPTNIDQQILDHLSAGRLAAARRLLARHRDRTTTATRLVTSRRTDAATAGWEAARAAVDAGQRSVAAGHLRILEHTAADWRGPARQLPAEAAADLDRFAVLAGGAERETVSRHAVERFQERVAPGATHDEARDALLTLLRSSDTRRDREMVLDPQTGARVVVGRIGRRTIARTVLT
jgi:hypothetical protein